MPDAHVIAESLPRVIDADRALAAIDPLLLVDALEAAHRRDYAAAGRLHTVNARDGRPDADLLIWAGSNRDGSLGAKIVSVSPDNGALRDAPPTVHSAFVLLDPRDGRFRCFIVGESFTRCKTAADSALAARHLAPRAPKTLVLLGAGAQAPTHVGYLQAVCPTIERIEVWNRSPERAERLVRESAWAGDVRVTTNLEASVRDADIVVCLTSSATPVLRGAWLREGCHVDLVGGFTPQMREADDEAMVRAHLYVDHRHLVSEHCGDIRQPLDHAVITGADIRGDLFDLCSRRVAGRRDEREITLFKNGGGGHLDLMVAQWLFDIACPGR